MQTRPAVPKSERIILPLTAAHVSSNVAAHDEAGLLKRARTASRRARKQRNEHPRTTNEGRSQ
eukprot:10575502-Alexandrium_andersonii.AAC.1